MICIAGQNNIAVYFAEFLIKNNYTFVACLNKNDLGLNNFNRSFNRFCYSNKIKIYELEELYTIENLIFFSLEFDQIIIPAKFKTKKLYNLHFSLLPSYKGMYTSAWPILNGEKKSGVTIHVIDNGIDTGDIIYQKKFSIKNLNCEQLYTKYVSEGLDLLIENFSKILNDNYSCKKQKAINSTYFSKKSIDYKNLKINLHKTAFQIDSQIRAYYFPCKQHPLVYDKKIYKSDVLKVKSKEKPGAIYYEDEDFIILNTIDYNIKLYISQIETLFTYAKNGDIESIIKKKDKNHDIKIRNDKGWDLLIIATYNGKIDLVRYLIEFLNWDVNTNNYNGTSFLMYAMTHASNTNDLSILKYSLNLKDIEIYHTDFFNKNVFDYALEYANLNVINLLKSKS